MRVPLFLHHLLILLLQKTFTNCATFQNVEGRYSFSLTTFSPTGKLQQVEYAIRASLLGTPVIATTIPTTTTINNITTTSKSILFISPYILPSPFINNDGTTRFVQLTSSIVLTFSGISADGRRVVSHAQKLAVEYEYTYEDEIPIDVLLEEISLLFQSYTSKPAARPFGCSLLIGYLYDDNDVDKEDDEYEGTTSCKLYQIDPSGSVTDLGNLGCIGRQSSDIMDILENQLDEYETANNPGKKIVDQKDMEGIFVNALVHSGEDMSSSNEIASSNKVYMAALFNKKDGLLCSSIVKQ